MSFAPFSLRKRGINLGLKDQSPLVPPSLSLRLRYSTYTSCSLLLYTTIRLGLGFGVS